MEFSGTYNVDLDTAVEREEEIRAFVPREYWSITADLSRIAPNLGRFKADFYGREKRMELGSEEAMCAFCAGIQAAAPVDSFAAPIPGDMPGYDSQVIMAAGAFVQGSSIELSADGPIRPPYAVYFQGGLTWNHAKLGVLLSLQKLADKGLAKL